MDSVEEMDESLIDTTDEGANGGAIDGADNGADDGRPVDIVKVQQDFYELFKNDLSDRSTHGYSEILNKMVLKDMIESTILFYTKMNEKELISFCDCLWEQRKFTGSDDLRISQLFVCCVLDAKGKISYPLNIQSKQFTIRPIYRIPKCFKNNQHQRDCCAVFVDEFARVYKCWEDLIKNNKYGNCLVVAPKGGFYDVSKENEVELDIWQQKDGIVKYVDYGSTAASIGSAGVVVAALAVSVAPVALTAATVAGVSCAVYSAGRSVYQLYDRKKHDQSVGLGNRESRAAYFNIASGALCAGAAVGAKVAAQAALNRQTISNAAQRTIRYVGIGSLGFQVAGCADELYCIISDLRQRKPISTVYLAQFGAQVFLLALSVKNYRLTEKLTEVSGQRNPKTIRRMLRQHNSDGSFKYLFAGADYIEQNIQGLANPMMLKSLFTACLNVSQKVKTECENYFDLHFQFTFDKLSKDGKMKKGDSMDKLLLFFLNNMNLRSLDKFLELTNKYALESAKMHKSRANLPLSIYLKAIYMLLVKNENNVGINDFISALNDDSFNTLIDEIKTDGFAVTNLNFKFDSTFSEQLGIELSLGRKIYLIVENRCQKFMKDFVEFPIETTLDHLAESIQYVLKRLAIEGATLFFGIAKQILNECLAQFVNSKFSTNEFIKDTFIMLLKKCNGNLTLLERNLKMWFHNDNGQYDRIKKETIDYFFTFARNRALKKCKNCDGETFI